MALCNEKNITVNKLADLSGLTQSTIDSILKGKSSNPRIETITKIAKGFNINPDIFFARVMSETDFNAIYESYLDALPAKVKQLILSKSSISELCEYFEVSRDKLIDGLDFYDYGKYYWLHEIAQYFDVSTDFLLGRTDNPKVNT